MTTEELFLLAAFAVAVSLIGVLIRFAQKSAVEKALTSTPTQISNTSVQIGYAGTDGRVEDLTVRISRAYRKDGLVFFEARTPGFVDERTFSVHNVTWLKDDLTNEFLEGAAARAWFKSRVT